MQQRALEKDLHAPASGCGRMAIGEFYGPRNGAEGIKGGNV
ncbi:hypothetical protein VSX61_07165 [Brenneria populi subsp. brevivirga]|nr:hypothetical protein [Brenneria populi subsp. brevivirga]